MKRRLLSLLAVLHVCLLYADMKDSHVNSCQRKELPDYYVGYLDRKAEEIARLRRNEAGGFFFWTDTHFPDNAGNAAAVLEYMQLKLGPCMLFNGGDVALNADRLAPGIEANSLSWHQAGRFGTLFPIRGNHDYTSTTSWNEPEPETMGNVEVAKYISSFLSPEAVKASSPVSNYYYVDNRKGRIRYVVFDTTDNVADSRVQYGISDPQYSWFVDEVVAGLPKGWKLMILSHVPLAADHCTIPSILKVGDVVKELAGRGKVLMVMSGHRHSDVESSVGLAFQSITAADCLVDVGRVQTPYSLPAGRKTAGTVDEQTIDYVSVSADRSKVTMKRIGFGHDRIFNVTPVRVKVGQAVSLKPSRKASVKWFVFDAEGNEVVQEDDGWHKKYVTSHKSASVSADGEVTLSQSGSAIAVALYEDGCKEFYMLATTCSKASR